MNVDADTLIAIAVSERPMVRERVQRHVHGGQAEDLTQSVMLRAVELIRAGRLVVEEGTDVRASVRAWLTAVLFRMVLSFYQRKKEPTEYPEEHADVDALATSDPTERLEAREALRQALYRVNKREREVIHRTAIGERLSEIAKALSIPEGTATNTLRTVRIALKKRRSRGR
jgi:RNA polymerase sigma factor (sigma-70 family)